MSSLPPNDGDPKASASLLPVDNDIQNVFDLLIAHSQGGASSHDALEAAVSQLVGPSADASTIDEDKDDYDNLGPAPPESTSSKNSKIDDSDTKKVTWSGPTATLAELRQDEEEGLNPLDRIPLGKQGSKMLVTFGDGPEPNPEVVQAALLGARRLLQLAIQDARGLRRHMKGEYAQAKRRVHMGNKNVKPNGASVLTSTETADASLLYRAMQPHDRLAYNPKCGFDMEQIQELFPEEMNAYMRWSQMHDEYEASKETEEAAAAAALEKKKEDEKNGKQPEDTPASEEEIIGGHLKERAANFDVRTDDMKNDKYLTFAQVRRGGSFLPRSSGRAGKDEREWQSLNSADGNRGRRKDGMWDTMSMTSVRFLHWIGFDPKSVLAPPNDEATEALGFLGYDFMGRIVETAIQLRVGDAAIPELPPGEQLKLEDINQALSHSSIQPVPLYSGKESSKGQVGAQLYFGPGFERRVEMEMDE
jgi:hypothetical protein